MTSVHPLISICLPVLNARPFLKERFDSIFAQTFQNWELVVVDGHSDDGSWEYITQRCAGDQRVRLMQAPREGIYAAINLAIGLALGQWVYIATADDTMMPRCLDTLLALGSAGGGKCIAQCSLTLIDESSRELPQEEQWPRKESWFEVFGGRFDLAHERKAPFDGSAVMVFGTLITSLTQALFPRAGFEKIGPMPKEFGGAGDMAWEGLAGFFYDVVYTPERLATWRIHPAQATASGSQNYYERNVAVSQWVMSKLESLDRAAWLQAQKVGLSDYHVFACLRHRGVAESSTWRRAVTAMQLAWNIPRFYFSYAVQKIGHSAGTSDPVTNCRIRRIEEFLAAEAEVRKQQPISR